MHERINDFLKLVHNLYTVLHTYVYMDGNWFYPYDPETNNNQCRGGIAAHPPHKIPSKNPLEKF
jgi:hypothetical protein